MSSLGRWSLQCSALICCFLDTNKQTNKLSSCCPVRSTETETQPRTAPGRSWHSPLRRPGPDGLLTQSDSTLLHLCPWAGTASFPRATPRLYAENLRESNANLSCSITKDVDGMTHLLSLAWEVAQLGGVASLKEVCHCGSFEAVCVQATPSVALVSFCCLRAKMRNS